MSLTSAPSSCSPSTRSSKAVVFPLPGPPNRRTTSGVVSVIRPLMDLHTHKQRGFGSEPGAREFFPCRQSTVQREVEHGESDDKGNRLGHLKEDELQRRGP